MSYLLKLLNCKQETNSGEYVYFKHNAIEKVSQNELYDICIELFGVYEKGEYLEDMELIVTDMIIIKINQILFKHCR